MIHEAWSVGKNSIDKARRHKAIASIAALSVAFTGYSAWASSTHNSGVETEVNIAGAVASAIHDIKKFNMTSDLRVSATSANVTADISGGNINFSKKLPVVPDISVDCGFDMETMGILGTNLFVPAEAISGLSTPDKTTVVVDTSELLAETSWSESPVTRQYIMEDGEKKYNSAGKCQNVITAFGAIGSLAGDNPVEQSVRGTLEAIEKNIEDKTQQSFQEACMPELEELNREAITQGITDFVEALNTIDSDTASVTDGPDSASTHEVEVKFTSDEFAYGEQYVPVLQDDINDKNYMGEPKATLGDWEFDSVGCKMDNLVVETSDADLEAADD